MEALHKSFVNDFLSKYSLFFGSILTFGAMIGAITSGPIADFVGRKGALRVSSVFCSLGWLAIYFAEGPVALDVGRLATGYGMGVFSYVVPVFIAEIAPKDLRGSLTAANQLMIVAAVSLSFVIGTVTPWRMLALTGVVPCIVLVTGLSESPRWLAKTWNHKEFQAALRKLRDKDADISEEAAEIQDYIETLEKLPKAKLLDLFQKRYLRSVVIGVGLMVCQQFGGINGICFYTSSIFESAGFPADLGTIIYALLQIVITALNALFVDKAGRKPLLLVSAMGLVMGCLLIALSFYLKVTVESMGIHHQQHLLLPFLFLAALPLSTSYHHHHHHHHRTLLQSNNVSCPLNFDLLRRLAGSRRPTTADPATACRYAQQGLRLVEADYLLRTNSFVPPLNSAESCWASYQILANDFFPNFDLRQTCRFQTNWIAVPGCMNISTRQEFESHVSRSSLNPVISACNQSLSGSSCSTCTVALSTLQASYLNGDFVGNLTDCRAYPFIYAAAFVNPFGPTDRGTAACLFSLDIALSKSKNKHKTLIIVIVAVIVAIILFGIAIGFWFYRNRKLKRNRRTRNESNTVSALDSIIGSTTLTRYTIEDIKVATRNFSRDNIIGRGGYGNVYKGVLPDETEVALKRFKNCSAAGDASFTHEVEVIASVRHVNLVGLRGYCTATTSYEGHQRIIVCDLVKNGSLHDHLFGEYSSRGNLSWPIRRKIALGTACGLAYLHYGAQPTIIHRDIKASNILLDENFEAKVADFGLAKFAPEGATHLSTRVAGTMGYVAPEYALYGQLTERSDVYSFGVVLLELLSGKKALITVGDGDGQPILLADWAWSMVRKGTPLEVIDDSMPECGSPEIMEKYVLAAVLASHPQLYARPTMDQVLKMLDSDLPIPSIPERPIPLIAGIEDIEKSVSSSGSGHLSTPRGYQSFEIDGQFSTKREEHQGARLSGGR